MMLLLALVDDRHKENRKHEEEQSSDTFLGENLVVEATFRGDGDVHGQ
jgi:hypothetical protein